MKLRHFATALLGTAAIGAMAPNVRAAAVLYDGVGFMQGTQSFSDSFSVSSGGTLSVTLGDAAWPQPLSSLNLLMSSSSGSLGSEMGVGTETFNILNPETLDAQWFGTAQGALDAGVYTLKIQFTPNSNLVPLPTSITLLLSGLGLLVWQRSMRQSGQSLGAEHGNLSNSNGPEAA